MMLLRYTSAAILVGAILAPIASPPSLLAQNRTKGIQAKVGSGEVGRRQKKKDAAANVEVDQRVQNRVDSRIEFRVQNRIDRYYDPNVGVMTPYARAMAEAKKAELGDDEPK